jgi:nucleoside-diphosphate-sugar epimerase
MSKQLQIAITGATGFIGRHVVAAARRRGHRVRALVRNPAKADPAWRRDPLIELISLDLSAENAAAELKPALTGVDATIHAAAALSGDDASHERNTVAPMEALLAAIAGRADGSHRLVLVSSLTVYDVRRLPKGQVLDETAPIEANPETRDAYCRSKLAQEALTLQAAEAHNLDVRIMRPGAVFGPERLWNGHIGQAVGPLVVQLETKGQVPVSFVDHCAEALVLAAERPIAHDDRPGGPRSGHVEIINILDDDLPDRERYMTALRATGWPRYVLRGSWHPLAAAAGMLSMLGSRADRRLPGLLRPAIIRARLQPVTYSNARLHERLGWRSSLTFEEAIRRAAGKGHREAVYACAN